MEQSSPSARRDGDLSVALGNLLDGSDDPNDICGSHAEKTRPVLSDTLADHESIWRIRFLQGIARSTMKFSRAQVVGDTPCRFVIAQALQADVADAVALGIGAPDARLRGKIDSQRIGSAEARPLADEQYGHRRAEQRSDLVTNSYASIAHDTDGGRAHDTVPCERIHH